MRKHEELQQNSAFQRMNVVGEGGGQSPAHVGLDVARSLGVFYTHWSLNNKLVMGRHMDRCSASESIRRLPKACRRL